MKKDYYEILGVPKDSSIPQIKKAYRSLALKHHPDRVPADKKKAAEERFKEISEAYGVLADPQKRKMYDQYGHSGIDQNFTTEDIFRGTDFESIFGQSGLGDIFGHFFGEGIFDSAAGRGQRTSRARRGRDIQYEVEITLPEAYAGGKKKIKVPRHEVCRECKGSGAKPGSEISTCPTCQGQGQVMTSSGFFRMMQTCARCHGRGKEINELCPTCSGQGVERITRTIEVSIPPGVDNDTRLRIKGEGEGGPGGAGDLYIYLLVRPHATFERVGKDIKCKQPVSFVKASLGSEISVPTLNGNVTMKIPPGTQSGKIFRLRGKGMPDLHGGSTGDQYVQVMLEVPTRLSAEQRKLLERYAEISGEKVGYTNDTIAEKIKKVFK